MIFKKQILKEYLIKKFNLEVDYIFTINKLKISDKININDDCEISYFVNVNNTPGYKRFNMKQMLNVVYINYKELLNFDRKQKLKNIL